MTKQLFSLTAPQAALMEDAARAWQREDLLDPWTISAALGQKFPPTDEQAQIICAGPGPLLVVAGAGAGKTETMAARVVWLVANGLVFPHEVLGLTFTRKATQELGERVALRLRTLAESDLMRQRPADDPVRHAAQEGICTTLTYDSYNQLLLGEYGLLLPVEPGRTVVNSAQLFQLALEVVRSSYVELASTSQPGTIAANALTLREQMLGHQVSLADLEAERDCVLAAHQRLKKPVKDSGNAVAAAQERLEYVKLVDEINAALDAAGYADFAILAAQGAQLVEEHTFIGAQQRRRFRVVLLDEYQDTSYLQRRFLRQIFGSFDTDTHDPHRCVVAVGDPMQAIYGFRGAVAANLERFVTDFRTASGLPAPKRQLLTSWRNPPQVLALANHVVDEITDLDTSSERLVDPLVSGPGSPDGQVTLVRSATLSDHRTDIAQRLAEARTEFIATHDRTPTMAVLLRKNDSAAPMADAVAAAGLTPEISSVYGLIRVPEVAHLLALLRVAVFPEDGEAVLTLLTNERWNLGVSDLTALAQRARVLSGRPPGSSTAVSDLESFTAAITSHLDTAEHSVLGVSLGDALADLGERVGTLRHSEGGSTAAWTYSESGYARLQELSAQLRWLRARLNQPLDDIVSAAEWISGVRLETLVRDQPGASGAGAAHLDAFATHVRDFAAVVPQASLRDLLDYLDHADKKERGLSGAELPPNPEAVQILTLHAAKGLEWDIIALVEQVAEGKRSSKAWNTAHLVPARLRGDAMVEGQPGGRPTIDFRDAPEENFTNFIKQHSEELRDAEFLDDARLFYVGLTRAKHTALVGTYLWKPGVVRRSQPMKCVEWLVEYAAQHPGTADLSAFSDLSGPDTSAAAAQDNPYASATVEAQWPVLNPLAVQRRAAADYLTELAEQQPATAGDASGAEDELAVTTSALIAEARRRRDGVEVAAPRRLSTSELVGLASDEQSFLRRLVRPVPMAPQPFARRGTAFHQWVEQHYTGGELELGLFLGAPGHDDDEIALSAAEAGDSSDPRLTLDALTEAFLASPWAQRDAHALEFGFEFTYDSTVVPGRIDAVFADPDGGYTIIDWKTGAIPGPAAWDAASVQLKVYVAAWRAHLRRTLGAAADEVPIRAGFHYILPRETRYIEPA